MKVLKKQLFNQVKQLSLNVPKYNIGNKAQTKFYQDLQVLERGQIPETLKYDRPYKQTVLPNGITVATENWPSPITTLSVNIMCGSRNENQETSGTAHFLEHLHFKGTQKRTREQLEVEIENIGGQLNAYTSRENTSYIMTVFDKKLEHGVEILGDILGNSVYSKQAVERERDTIYRELQETSKEEMETTVEISHRGTYKDHQMGLPILGKIQNIYSITRENVVEYHKNNYFGKNIMIVGAGNHDHDALCEYVEKYFNKFPVESPQDPQELLKQSKKPEFNHEVFMMKSDITQNINVGLFYEAPSWLSSHYYNFLLIQRILGDKPDTPTEQELTNYTNLNRFQKMLNEHSNIYVQKGIYTPYRDTGLFGNYFHGEINCLTTTIQLQRQIFNEYANTLTDEELEKAKRKLYIELLQHETGNDISQAIANHLQYFNRRIYRSEIAYRISSMTKQDIIDDINSYIVDKQFSATVWGNVESLLQQFQNKSN